MKTSINYLRYINSVNENLSAGGLRSLTFEEQCDVTAHLIQVVDTYPDEDEGGLDLIDTLALEAVKRTVELHPDLPDPTPEQEMKMINAVVDSPNVKLLKRIQLLIKSQGGKKDVGD